MLWCGPASPEADALIKGVGLLLVPAWDSTLDGWLHGTMAVMRGVASGFTFAGSAKQGILTVSDSRGRWLAHSFSPPVKAAMTWDTGIDQPA
jgi:apolipoprotein N-acyltransferase